MNKYEAIDALFAGKKVRREGWFSGKYICLRDGKLDKGTLDIRTTARWADDWELASIAEFKHNGKNYIVTEELIVEQV